MFPPDFVIKEVSHHFNWLSSEVTWALWSWYWVGVFSGVVTRPAGYWEQPTFYSDVFYFSTSATFCLASPWSSWPWRNSSQTKKKWFYLADSSESLLRSLLSVTGKRSTSPENLQISHNLPAAWQAMESEPGSEDTWYPGWDSSPCWWSFFSWSWGARFTLTELSGDTSFFSSLLVKQTEGHPVYF